MLTFIQAALAPMKDLDTLCLFTGSLPETATSKGMRVMKRAIQHLAKNLLDHGIRIKLIIVVHRELSYSVMRWRNIPDPYMYRIDVEPNSKGILRDIRVSCDVVLSDEERDDLIRIGADRIVSHMDYESMKLGKLCMGNKEVLAHKETFVKRRALEEKAKEQKAADEGLSKQEIRKRDWKKKPHWVRFSQQKK